MALTKLSLIGEQDGEGTLNRFWYFADPGNQGVRVLIDAFVIYVLPAILRVLTTAWEAKRIEAENVETGEVEVYDMQGAIGERTGDHLPVYNAWGFHLQPSISTLIKRGAKRFAGISEGSQNGGVPTGGELVDLNLLATLLKTVIGDAPGDLYSPGITRVIDQGPPVRRYFVNLSSAAWMRATTQNSRKSWLSGGGNAIVSRPPTVPRGIWEYSIMPDGHIVTRPDGTVDGPSDDDYVTQDPGPPSDDIRDDLLPPSGLP